MKKYGLPVEDVLDTLAADMKEYPSCVLCAPPGAGKTTLVPLRLLETLLSAHGKIIMLEPRRIAARAAASRMASLLGETPGMTVGYRTRLDTKISSATRIEVVTEGILTRFLQDDPSLPGVECVIFDEFHERSIHADLALALVLDVVNALRPDLKILVMSATLDSQRISALLGDAPVIRSEGRMFPVRTEYLPRRDVRAPLENDVASAVSRAAAESAAGHILVFLPGEAEIRRVHSRIKDAFPDRAIRPLYGNLPPAEQDRAIMPEPDGRLKIILATPVAETSLTVDGVVCVIDSGFMRTPKFSPRNGMSRLETHTVSTASADQRRGRAGRTAPGVCFRLWSKAAESGFQPFNTPEILESDLAPLRLELANWGIASGMENSLKWLDAPPPSKLLQADSLLRGLSAEDASGRITASGRRLLGIPAHPRLARAVCMAKKAGCGYTACLLAALLEERDLPGASTCDLRERLDIVSRRGNDPAVRRILESARRTARAAGIKDTASVDASAAGLITAFAYPDRIGVLRKDSSGDFSLSNGTGAKLRNRNDLLCMCGMIAAASVEGEGAGQIIYSAAPIELSDIEKYMPELFSESFEVEWNRERRAVSASIVRRLGEAVIFSGNAPDRAPREKILACLLDGIRSEGLGALPFGKGAAALRERSEFLRKNMQDSDMPDLSDEALLAGLETWLAPFIDGAMSLKQINEDTLHTALESMFSRKHRLELDKNAPERITVPSGSAIRVDYSSPDGIPVLPVKLQEIFGMTETPRVAGGRVPVTMKILSPAMRPVQITRDLANFWKTSYFLVRKDMRGRYPKHNWPENPLETPPSRSSIKRKMQN